MKNWLLLIVLVVNFKAANAVDMEQIKGKLRQYSNKFIGVDATNKYLGPSAEQMKLPPIPNIIENSKSTYTLPENSVLALQGQEFNNLSTEQKRPYYIAFLEELFDATRKQKVEDEEISKWLNILEQGSSREGVYRALVLDQVYGNLENFDDSPDPEAVKFTVKFYSQFLGRPVSEDSIRKLNIYSIKRVVTERSLDILEAYEENPEYLYSWYSLLSVELASNFEFENKIRDSKLADIHYSWSKGVPYQQIKSELIIKIHKLYNRWLK